MSQVDTFRIDQYRVMNRLLSEADIEYVATRGPRKTARLLRRTRRQLYLRYLSALTSYTWRENYARLNTKHWGAAEFFVEASILNYYLLRMRLCAVRHLLHLSHRGTAKWLSCIELRLHPAPTS